jgi:tryptophan synthase alpha chain
MSRIEGRFAALRAAGRKALIPFVTAGDPEPAATVPLLHALVEAGADLLELGVPFSDPMADGPVIQRASERAATSIRSRRSATPSSPGRPPRPGWTAS